MDWKELIKSFAMSIWIICLYIASAILIIISQALLAEFQVLPCIWITTLSFILLLNAMKLDRIIK